MKAVIITGPTASGKTKLGLKLAKQYNGAIISVDSVQVYKGLDVISGKDLPSHPLKVAISNSLSFYQVDNVPIFGLDVCSPTDQYSISQFHKDVKVYQDYISDQQMLPIFVGGSPLYINSVLNPPETLSIKPDLELRNELEKRTINELLDELRELNSELYESLNNSERNNKRRLVRKVEIFRSGVLKGKKRKETGQEYLILGLDLSNELLKTKIHQRIQERLKSGALEEAQGLFGSYNNLSPQVKSAIGYKDFFEYFKKEKTLEQAISDWELHEIQLVRKQRTWFKKMDIAWFQATSDNLFEATSRKIDLFLEG